MDEKPLAWWDQFFAHVGQFSGELPDGEYIREGFRLLRGALDDPEPGQPFYGTLQNLIPQDLRENAAFGHFLYSLRGQLGEHFEAVRERLLSKDSAHVDGVLAELKVFQTLQARGNSVHLIRATKSSTTADIRVTEQVPVTVEVSHVGLPETYRDAQQLHCDLEVALYERIQHHPMHVYVTIDGFANALRPSMAGVLEAFEALRDNPPTEAVELAPGFRFLIESCSHPVVHVGGARVQEQDARAAHYSGFPAR